MAMSEKTVQCPHCKKRFKVKVREPAPEPTPKPEPKPEPKKSLLDYEW